MKRVLSLWLPRLTTDRIVRKRPELVGRPFAAVMNEGGRLTVTAVNRAAELAGAAPGQSLADTRSLEPGLAAADADPAADARALARLADWCGRYTPWAGVDQSAPPGGTQGGGLWLDVTGCAHLFGGETGLIADLTNRLAGFGLTARAAIADAPGAAWAWARFGETARPVLERGAQPDALRPLPVEALRLPPADAATLRRLGLGRIGDLYAIPRTALAARFGDTIRRRLDQALGNTREPLSPRPQRPPYEARRAFGEPLLAPEGVCAALEGLLRTLHERLERDGMGARRLVFSLYRIDGSAARAAIGTSRPARDPAHLLSLFRPKLETLQTEPGVELASLAAPLTAAFAAEQSAASLPPSTNKPSGPPFEAPPAQGRARTSGRAGLSSAPAHPEVRAERASKEEAELIDRLANRLGPERVGRIAPCARHLPEARTVFRPAGETDAAAELPATGGAPLRLLPKPEPVETPPADTDETAPPCFTWRRRNYPLARAEGPERLLGDWWRGDTAARDYYRVEDAEGRGFWLYRDLETRRWYLHGLS